MIKKIIIYFLILIINLPMLNLSLAQQNQERNKALCIFSRNLKIGSKGEDVKCLQEYLKELNLFNHNPTGYYGFLTRNAVLKWQKINGLKQTGIFDFNSIMKYYNLISSKRKIQLLEEKEITHQTSSTTSLFTLSIQDQDIIIDPSASKNIGDYFYNFSVKMVELENYRNVLQKMFTFVFTGTTTIIDNEKSLFKLDEPLLPGIFVENNLKFNPQEKEKLKEKILLLKSMFEFQTNEGKKFPVHPDLKNLHKFFISANVWGIELLNKFLEYLDNKISEEEIKLYLAEYNKKINEKRTEIVNEYSKLAKSTTLFDKPVYKFLSYLFALPQKSFAFPFLTFGGKIMVVNFCYISCPAGIPVAFLVDIGPPRPIRLFVPFAFLGSPLNYMYRQIITEGVWALGLATLTPMPCYQCAKKSGIFGSKWVLRLFGRGFPVFMSGTSQVPSPF